MIIEYVLGLAFWRDQVALIYKTKGPSYVIDTWNGIGGKVESQDDGWIEGAMSREFCEETGLFISPDIWQSFAVINGEGFKLHCLKAVISDHEPFVTERPVIENTEGCGERVQWFSLYRLPSVTPNLNWVIPLALDETTGFLEIRER